jgi:hypothetical protein
VVGGWGRVGRGWGGGWWMVGRGWGMVSRGWGSTSEVGFDSIVVDSFGVMLGI